MTPGRRDTVAGAGRALRTVSAAARQLGGNDEAPVGSPAPLESPDALIRGIFYPLFGFYGSVFAVAARDAGAHDEASVDACGGTETQSLHLFPSSDWQINVNIMRTAPEIKRSDADRCRFQALLFHKLQKKTKNCDMGLMTIAIWQKRDFGKIKRHGQDWI